MPPESKPRTLARATIHNPTLWRGMERMALPEPHAREDADERSFSGSFVDRSEAAETAVQYVRLPLDVMSLLHQVVNDPTEAYQNSVPAFIRHAVLELLFQHYERRKGRRNAPEVVQYLKQMEASRETAWEIAGIRGLKEFMRGTGIFLAQAIEHGNVKDVHKKLESLAALLKGSTSDTWTAEFRGLARADPVLRAAVNYVVKEWTNSSDAKERAAAQRWESWFSGLKEE